MGEGGSPLCVGLYYIDADLAVLGTRPRGMLRWSPILHLVDSHGFDKDWRQHLDAADRPAELWLPVNCLQQTFCGRWSDDIVSHSINFEFGARKQGVCPFARTAIGRLVRISASFAHIVT